MSENELIQKFLMRLQPHFAELYRMAHAITANAELAETALIYGMQSAFLDIGEDVSFREGVRRAVIQTALACLSTLNREEYPADFVCFELTDEAGEVGAWLAGEKNETRHLMLLRYGCGLGAGDAGRALGISRQAVRRIMADAQANFERAVSSIPFDRAMLRAAKEELNRTDAFVADMGAVFRTFEASAQSGKKPQSFWKKAVRQIFCALFALILAGMVWLYAAITDAPEPEAPSPTPEFSLQQSEVES